jgi:ABC-type uncharacterized transport system involved in gliding motility auxiliary subunit
MQQRKLAYAGLGVAAVFLIALTVWSSLSMRGAQVDLTKSSLYTLTDGTREVLASIKEPITLRLFLSRQLVEQAPVFANYAVRVRELLERYVSLSNDKIRLELIQPEAFSREEDRAVGFDLQGVPLNQADEKVYFGLAGTNTTDDTDVIAFFNPQRERFLEYDLTRLIYNLSNPKKKVIGLVSALPIESDPTLRYKPWRVVEIMKQTFEVKSLGLEPEIKDDIDVLMVVHPIGLSDKALFQIDQFILKGGKAMIFVDPYAEEGGRANQAMRLPPDRGSDLAKLFKAWGIDYDRNKVLGDATGAQRVSIQDEMTGRPVVTDYLPWITIPADQLKRDDPITGELQVMNVATAGVLKKAEGADITLDPLIVSSPRAAALDANKARMRPDPKGLQAEFKSGDQPLIIAARVNGKLKTAFPDGPPVEKKDEAKNSEGKPADEKPADAPTFLRESAAPANLIVVSDTDILADSFWLQVQDFFGQRISVPTANNGDFVVNALDNLAGGAALLKLRGRGVSDRPFHVVQALQKEAELQYRAKEQALGEKLKEVEGKLKDLQTKDKAGGKSLILAPEQREEIEKSRLEMVALRTELRDVQRALRQNIDKLDSRIKLINIAAMPVLVLIFAVGLAIVREQRTRRRRAAA